MFDDGKLVDRFIEGWRRTGEQRVGFLLGRYTEYTDVPLGIRATVSAIYEPPQVSLEEGGAWSVKGVWPCVIGCGFERAGVWQVQC